MPEIHWPYPWHPHPDADGSEFTQALVNSEKVAVRVSAEAIQDHGRGACAAKAVELIRAAMQGDKPPASVLVRNSNFP
jgi:hypothetical protein